MLCTREIADFELDNINNVNQEFTRLTCPVLRVFRRICNLEQLAFSAFASAERNL